jgi:carbonic anhydrase/acetyltransferase-like protein (isoleucine patch superfamily)
MVEKVISAGPGVELEEHEGVWPAIHAEAWVHPSCVLIGDVVVGRWSSLWPGVVLRGDQGSIRIGEETSLQDGTIVHSTLGWSHTVVGHRVTVGHRVILHGCQVEDDVLVGMGAILMDNVRVGRHSIIGAGAVVSAGKVIPPRSLVLGVPARVVRTVTDAEIQGMIAHGHEEYVRLTRQRLAPRAGS